MTELGASAGLQSDIDVTLCRHLCQNVPADPNKKYEEYENCCLLLVYAAVSIPFLAKDIESEFNPNFASHKNNTQCIAKVYLYKLFLKIEIFELLSDLNFFEI